MDQPRRGYCPGRSLAWLIVASALGWSVALAESAAVPLRAGSLRGSIAVPLHGEDLAPLATWWTRCSGPGSATGPGHWLVPMALIGCAAAAVGVMARMTAREAGPRAGLCAASAMALTGAFGPAGGAFALVDAPGWLFWLLTVERLGAALDSPRRPRGWLGVGVAWAGALACHPHAALLPLGVALGLALDRPPWGRAPGRQRLGRALVGGLAAAVLGLGAASGLGRGGDWQPGRVVLVAYAQAVQMFPWFWVPLVWGLAREWVRWASGRDRDATAAGRVRLGVATVTWGLLTLGAATRPTLPHWGLIGLATLLPALGRRWAGAPACPSFRVRFGLGLPAAATAAALAFGLGSALLGGGPAVGRPGTAVVLRSIAAAGWRWDYAAYAPHPPDGGRRRLPVVLLLHGSGSRGRALLDQAHWSAKAEEQGFLVVAPDAPPLLPWRAPHPLFNPRTWNSGQHGPDHPRSRVDDLAFFDALIDDLARRWRIDRGRLYVVGHSSGGAMAFRLAAERSAQVAAIASVSGACYLDDPRPERPVPTLAILGTKDVLLPRRGGLSVLPWEARRTPPFRETMGRWARALGGRATPAAGELLDGGRRIVKHYGPAPDDLRLTVMLLHDHGHAWPGSPGRRAEWLLNPTLTPTDLVDATDLTWDFFRGRSQPAELSLAEGITTRR